MVEGEIAVSQEECSFDRASGDYWSRDPMNITPSWIYEDLFCCSSQSYPGVPCPYFTQLSFSILILYFRTLPISDLFEIVQLCMFKKR